jgi:hypothetical protein
MLLPTFQVIFLASDLFTVVGRTVTSIFPVVIGLDHLATLLRSEATRVTKGSKHARR